MMNTNIDIESLLYGNYIQYNRLYTLNQHALYQNQNNTLDLYIDMNSLTSILYMYNNIHISDPTILTSSIINLVCHIRNYYWTREKIHCRAFIVYSPNFPRTNRELVPEYNQKRYQSYITNDKVTNLIKDNVAIMETLCPYLFDIHFIHSNEYETMAIMYDLFLKNNEYRLQNKIGTQIIPNIVITKDPNLYQLVAIGSRTFIFRPKKVNGEDYSWVVTKRNIFDMYEYDVSSGNINIQCNFPHSLLSLFMSIAGLRCRNINSIHNYKSTLDIIHKAISDGKLLPEYSYDINNSIDILSSYSKRITENKELIINRYKAIDLVYNQLYLTGDPGTPLLYKDMVNLFDMQTVKQINNEYFLHNPLDLQWL